MKTEGFVSHRTKRNFRRARQALLEGKYEELRDASLRCVNEAPQIEDGWFMLAQAFSRLGYNHDGFDLMEKALEQFPDSYTLRVQYCKFLIALGKRRECLQQIDSLLSLSEPDPWSNNVLAQLLIMLDEVKRAMPLCRRACELSPQSSKSWLELANAERYCGDFESARKHCQQALQLNPAYARAYWIQASLGKATSANNSIETIQQALTNPDLASTDEAFLQFALAKELEDCEQWDMAFDAVTAAGVSRRKSKPYQHRDSEELVNTLISYLDSTFLNMSSPGYDNHEPIFIVGMPRTGTTLIERILGRHSEVYAAGELRQFALALKAQTDGDGSPVLSAQQVVEATRLDFNKLGETYIENTRPRTGHTPHFIDKMPVNYLYLGFIAKSLPNAKIIHMTRNPMDTCWSNFKQFFGDLYEYSYELIDTARYITLYDRLMRHWRETLPGRFIDVSYEALVENPQQESLRVFDYCGLEWQDACLEYHRSAEAVTTASSVQVRQPIYRNSLQRWKKLEHRMGEVKAIFDEAGIAY